MAASKRRHGQAWPDDLPADIAEALRAGKRDSAVDNAPLYDAGRIERLLHDAARQRRAISYSELLAELGFQFTRPRMRTVCKTLDLIDREARQRGEPELAVLVVRESDRLPGQGWWVGREDHQGPWEGAAALAFVAALQARAFDYWSKMPK